MYYRKLLLMTLLATAASACAAKDSTEGAGSMPPATPNIVTFTALDFTFDGPTEVPAGPTTFRLVSSGKEIHHMQLVKLEEGRTVDSLMAAMRNPGPPPTWAVFVGGPNAPAPGGESNATVNLEAGSYALICLVDTPDKTPHMMKGMFRGLTVTPAADGARAGALPPATVTLTLADYTFTTDKDITAGKHTIKVVNGGPQPHEVEIIRMDAGKTVADMGAWIQTMQGPPPGVPVGGVAALVPGREMQFDVDFTPGEYLLICFVPDPKGGMHLDHGMTRTITIP